MLIGALHLAIDSKDVAKVQRLVKRNVDVNGKNKDGVLPIHRAIHVGAEPIVEVLASAGADLEKPGPHGSTALIAACRLGAESLARVLIRRKASLDVTEGDMKLTPLMIVAAQGHTSLAREMLQRKPEIIDARSRDGTSALMMACLGRHDETVEALLEFGPDTTVRDSGETPLELAVRTGRSRVVSALVRGSADVNAVSMINGLCPLMTACAANKEPMVSLLLDLGADPNAREACAGRAVDPPIVYAAARSDDSAKKIIRLLVKKGADVNAVGRHCISALYRTCRSFSPSLVKVLLDLGADPNNADALSPLVTLMSDTQAFESRAILTLLLEHGLKLDLPVLSEQSFPALLLTPMAYACYHRKTSWVKILFDLGAPFVEPPHMHIISPLSLIACDGSVNDLKDMLKKGADPMFTDSSGCTALHHVCKHNLQAQAALLMSHGLSPDVGINESRTPLHFAAEHGHHNIINVLVIVGASIEATSPLDFYATPLLIAARHGNAMCVRTLLRHGANMDAVDSKSRTALDLALTCPKNSKTIYALKRGPYRSNWMKKEKEKDDEKDDDEKKIEEKKKKKKNKPRRKYSKSPYETYMEARNPKPTSRPRDIILKKLTL